MMKKFYLVFAGFLAFSLQLQAQCTDVTLSSQADVNSFQSASGGCSTVSGTLVISGSDITDLTPLSGITSVHFLVISQNPMLASVNGLGGLTQAGSIHIASNPLLTDLTGFTNLAIVDDLSIVYNDGLHNFNGLSAVEITHSLSVRGMTLTDFSTLSAPDSLTSITLEDNYSIGSLHGLENIQKLGTLEIARNGQLANLDGLSGLMRVSDLLQIEGNPDLTSVSGVPNLGYVNRLSIGGNATLPDLNGLSGLTKASEIQLISNAALASLQGLSNVSGGLSLLKVQSIPLLTNLLGLEGISSIGDLIIVTNSNLVDLTGLTLAHSGSIEIIQNPKLTSLDGLNNLTTIDGGLTVSTHEKLVDISALSSITEIKGSLRIESNTALQNIDGFSSLTSISQGPGDPGEAFVLRNNTELVNLDGFHKLTNINGDVLINGNTGLQNVDSLSAWTTIRAGAKLTVTNNTILSRGCGFYNILHTSNPPSVFSGNGPGVTKDEILANGPCRSVAPCTGDVILASQADIDSFSSIYGCTQIDGSLTITGADITNLDGLYQLTSTGPLYIQSNPVLKDLSGLRNVTLIKQGLYVNDNKLLENVDSLSSLATISGSDRTLYIVNNPNLTKGCGLYNVIVNDFYGPFSSGSLVITGNGAGVTEEEILNAGKCEPGGTTCYSNTTLTTQAQVDNFYATRSCVVYDGRLMIRGDDITNLDSLHRLTSVKDLTAELNPNLTDVSGLSNIMNATEHFSISYNTSLASISLTELQTAGNFYIMGNDSLVTLDLPAFTGGHNIEIEHNPNLETLEGISSITHADILIIDANDKLTSLHGLENITNVSVWLAINQNANLADLTGLSVTNVGALSINRNPNLVSLEGLNNLATAGGGSCQCETRGVFIDWNVKLENIDALSSLTTIYGDLTIKRNTSLTNFDGLWSLTSIGIYTSYNLNRGLDIEDNTALQNVDGLSSLTTMPSNANLVVKDNSNLTRGCGLYNVLVNSNPPSIFSGNGPGVVKTNIINNGPCRNAGDVTAPTSMMFADVTDNSMTVSFTSGSGEDGNMILMRAFESALPNDTPVDGTEYHVGDVIGCCSIVVGMGMDTTHSVVYLEQDVDYYFNVIPYIASNKYIVAKALTGYQGTTPHTQPYPNPFVEELTIPFTINEEGANVKIMIMDQLGRAVSEVVNNQFDKGKHIVKWGRIDLNGNRVGNGVYMYSIVTNDNEPIKGLFVAK